MGLKELLKNRVDQWSSIFKIDKDDCYNIILLFLLTVLIIAFVIPIFSYGRLFGTDEYTHLFHAIQIFLTDSMGDFYQQVTSMVSNPDDPNAPYTYPFAIWLLGGTVAKLIGTDPKTAIYLYAVISVFILLITFYLYSDLFLKTKTQKLLALLFLLSMPNIALIAVNFRPSSIVLPFVLLSLYCVMKEKFSWKLAIMMIVSVFIITIMHTGTYIFLLSLSLVFLFLYCLVWGKFSKPVYLMSASMLFIYVISVSAFPYIHPQYIDKATMFLKPGDFLASKLNILLADDLSWIFYSNLFVDANVAYAILWSALIYALCLLFLFAHKKMEKHIAPLGGFYQIAVLPTNLSKGLASIPIWLGPIHVLLSCIGFFRLNSKGKSLMIAALVVCIFPEFQRSLADISISTGAVRNITYLFIIIPITAVLGIDYLVNWFYKDSMKNARTGTWLLYGIFTIIFASFIVVPALGTSYYQPEISGDDYIVDGMTWLSNIGSSYEGVSGYGLRTTPIFTGKKDIYHLSYGDELKRYQKSLRDLFYSGSEQAAQDLNSYYGVRYILVSDKIAANLGGSQSQMHVDDNIVVDKIYSSKDFGIYRNSAAELGNYGEMYHSNDITIHESRSNIIIESTSYMLILNHNSPQITYIGTNQTNYLGDGHTLDFITIDLVNGEKKGYNIFEMPFSTKVQENNVIYTCLLQNSSGQSIGTMNVTYSFYENSIRRESVISNDWSDVSSGMQISATTRFFSPITNFILFGDDQRIEKKVYPSEDSSPRDDKFYGVFLQNEHSGIYIEYLPTSPYPSDLLYSGSVTYTNYCLFQFKQETLKSIAPGASFKSVQCISIGDEVTARRRVDEQRSI
ncbi:hypothetical protein, partial [Methanocalculus sp.]|uniref:hypothetical protein n=1 Tax=Methanocalculus sp. TaxID=2004547 RepID=UPI00261283E3